MAEKRTKKPSKNTKPSSAKSSSPATRVTRISASDTKKPAKAPSAKAAATPVMPKAPKLSTKASKRLKSPSKTNPATAPDDVVDSKNPLVLLARYFRGAWYELNQVRWPDRATTWQMTGALLAFTAFFVLLIVLLDGLFKYLFEFILG